MYLSSMYHGISTSKQTIKICVQMHLETPHFAVGDGFPVPFLNNIGDCGTGKTRHRDGKTRHRDGKNPSSGREKPVIGTGNPSPTIIY